MSALGIAGFPGHAAALIETGADACLTTVSGFGLVEIERRVASDAA